MDLGKHVSVSTVYRVRFFAGPLLIVVRASAVKPRITSVSAKIALVCKRCGHVRFYGLGESSVALAVATLARLTLGFAMQEAAETVPSASHWTNRRLSAPCALEFSIARTHAGPCALVAGPTGARWIAFLVGWTDRTSVFRRSGHDRYRVSHGVALRCHDGNPAA